MHRFLHRTELIPKLFNNIYTTYVIKLFEMQNKLEI